jgi:hypothetical protein
MNAAYTLGRIFIPIVFIVEAIQSFLNVGEFAKKLAASQLPIPDEIANLLVYFGNPPKYEALGYLRTVGPHRIKGALGGAGARCVHGVHHHLRPSILGGRAGSNCEPDRGAERVVDHGRTFADRRRGSGSEFGRGALKGRAHRLIRTLK